ncbi:Uncharacterised protein [Mycobacteroides abscessus subsp. bolletii]|nr:Uncharacterised protein [Mycobacteroides abscessus subsp. bolletii]SKP83549.1 Uncharacterised protein [Mycobacteroides abscessus subsp. bolletii]SKP98994.1 Uncharacterised protein [Mycobacteroides abscessus subsp. bolletii]SKQ17496.1 Uncharacterised protein [Mycobacteroides abscessus subsp. bolletii]
MNLAQRLGPVRYSRSGCSVCRWYDQLDAKNRADFDNWIAQGGEISHLWRVCASDPVNPLNIQRARFSEHVRLHHGS